MGSVGLDQLKALAELAPTAKPKQATNGVAPSGTGDYSTLDVVAWFQAHGHYGKARPDGKHAVHCPWHDQHSDDPGAQSPDTVVWPADGGWPTFHCSHNHCAGRDLQAVMDLWGDADRFCAATFEKVESWRVGVASEEGPVSVEMPATFPEVNGTAPKITEGRQDALRTSGAALRRQGLSEAAICAALLTINREQCDPPLDEEAVEAIAAELGQFEPSEAQDWRVSAASNAFTGVDPVRKINTDPPRYEVTVRGELLELSARELGEWKAFKFACMVRLNYIPELPAPAHPQDKSTDQVRWEKEILGPALERMKKRGQFEEAPEDAGERGAAWQNVLAFFGKKRLTEDRDEVVNDRLWHDEGHYFFRGCALRDWLADNKKDQLDPGDLWDVVRKHGGKPYNLRVKPSARCPKGQLSVWKVPDPNAADRAS